MPRRVYSPDEKADALQLLEKYENDIAATAYQTGIPQRTLYTWRMEVWDQQRQRRQSQPPPPPKELPKMEYENAMEALEGLRTMVFQILARIPSDLSHLPPYLQKDHHAARITGIDIILKLTAILGIPEPEYDEIEYVHEIITEEPKREPKITHTYIHVPPPVYVDDDAVDGLPPYAPA